MQIKSVVAGAAIALIAGVGSVSADENDVAGTAVNTGTPFALLDGIATVQMTVQELAATRGAGSPVGAFFSDGRVTVSAVVPKVTFIVFDFNGRI